MSAIVTDSASARAIFPTSDRASLIITRSASAIDAASVNNTANASVIKAQ